MRALPLWLAVAALLGPGAARASGARHRRARTGASATASPLPALVAMPAPPRASGPTGNGHVQFVTDKRAYLDRGSNDGLGNGQSLQFLRGGRAAGSCTVETASRQTATCVGGRPRVGDTFRPPRRRSKKAEIAPRVPVLAPVTDEETLAGRAAHIADAAIEKVEFTGKRAFRSHATVDARPGFAVWFTPADPRSRGYSEQRIDGAIHGVDLGGTGFRFDGAFSALRWSAPVALERFRPATTAQFYLWEAEAARRMRDGGTTAAVGRLWPFHTPGLTLLDGVQLGRQNQERTAEGGVYGGLIPTAASVAPSFDTWTAGLYGALSQVADRHARVRLAREEARIGVWRGTLAGVVTEAEALAEAWVGAVVLGGGGRARMAARDAGHPVIEHAHLDLNLRPTLDVGAGLHFRYVGATLLPDAPLRAEAPATGGALHVVADGRWDLSPGFGVAARAAAHRDGETGRGQLQGGAEARFPRLLGGGGGLWLGTDVQQGWVEGEAVYVQLVAHHQERIRLVARVSFDGTRFQTPAVSWNLHELGGYLDVEGTLTPWLRLRAWSLLRAEVLVQGEGAPYPTFGGTAGLSLAGSI